MIREKMREIEGEKMRKHPIDFSSPYSNYILKFFFFCMFVFIFILFFISNSLSRIFPLALECRLRQKRSNEENSRHKRQRRDKTSQGIFPFSFDWQSYDSQTSSLNITSIFSSLILPSPLCLASFFFPLFQHQSRKFTFDVILIGTTKERKEKKKKKRMRKEERLN